MEFVDLHLHALYGVDDGAKTEEEMYAMIDAAYLDGSRMLFLTPHFYPRYFGENWEKSERCFNRLRDYVQKKYPDLRLILGNELHYSPGCITWIEDGFCRTLGQTEYLLVDFSLGEKATVIEKGLNQLLNGGYTPILAHPERYYDLWGKWDLIRRLRSNGVYIQLDTKSLLGDFGFRTKYAAKGMLARRMVDFVGSDAHDLKRRSPGIQKAYCVIKKKCGEDYAIAVCGLNAKRLFDRQEERILNDE